MIVAANDVRDLLEGHRGGVRVVELARGAALANDLLHVGELALEDASRIPDV